jgi:cell wall-associated NlpC family hydrolase
MRMMLKRTVVVSTVIALSIVTACGNTPQAQPNNDATKNNTQQAQRAEENGMRGLAKGNGITALNNEDATIPITAINETNYISAKELANVLKFQSNWQESNRSLQLGDNDASFELSIDTTRAVKEGDEIKVADPFVMQGDSAYIPVSALPDLFQEEMNYEVRGKEVIIRATPGLTMEREEDDKGQATSPELEFVEDPNDPFKGENSDQAKTDAAAWSQDEDAVPVLKNININAMISKSKQYLGVPYLFGAGPYASTGRFDCSTYTQYLYGKYGYDLPRLSRQQARYGNLVNRKNLRRGDLMFFYVPGRFKTNKKVGHVGIYIGNMQMIHSSPQPKNGVQITNINKAYWKETFLHAKRVVY